MSEESTEPKCPKCGTLAYTDADTVDENDPVWKCSNPECEEIEI